MMIFFTNQAFTKLAFTRSLFPKLAPTNAIAIILFILLFTEAKAAPVLIPAPPNLSASSYFLLDPLSGKVIVAHNEDQRLPPASLTKMMTSYVLSYELAEGSVKKDDLVTISKNAWAQNFPGSSLMWIEVGKKVAVADLHKGVVISSGNDASVAIAEHIAGSEPSFADVMNQHADILGMRNTNFVNSHGLPHPDHFTTAKDLAILAKAIIYNYPDDYGLYKEESYTYNNIKTTNRNTLLWRDPSVDGLKTGHTKEAGYCLVASAQKNGTRLISVVMGTNSQEMRLRETQQLFSYGFRYYQNYKLYSAGDTLNDSRVWGGVSQNLPLGVDSDVYLTIPKGQRENIKVLVDVGEAIKAPVSRGQPYGKIKITLNDETLFETDLLAQQSIEQAGLFSRLWDELQLFIKQAMNF